MEDEGRKKTVLDAVFGIQKKRNFLNKNEHLGSNNMLERSTSQRRQLHSYHLTPPDYIIDPQILLEQYIEKQVRLAGIIPSVSAHLDTTSRTETLRVIDKGQVDKSILTQRMTSIDHDVVFSLSVNNIKITKRDGLEDLVLRVPIHSVSTVCYIQDDRTHILALKYGDPTESMELCKLAVFYCDSRATSEEVCSLIGQCFQLIYTDATMQYFDKKVQEGASGDSISSTRSSDSSTQKSGFPEGFDRNRISFQTNSVQNLPMGSTTNSTISRLPSRRSRSNTHSESELSTSSATELLQDYIKRMQKDLTSEELRRFASLVPLMHDEMDANFETFCEEVLELYGPQRQELLYGMRDFIPEKHLQYFEGFLNSVGITGKTNVYDGSRQYRRTLSEVSSFSNTIGSTQGEKICDNFAFNAMLSNLATDVENLERSVDVETNPRTFMPHR